jgi:hypothetical protein
VDVPSYLPLNLEQAYSAGYANQIFTSQSCPMWTVIFTHFILRALEKKPQIFGYCTDIRKTILFSSVEIHNFILSRLDKTRALQSTIFFIVSWGGLRLSPLGTSATNLPIVPAPDDK